MKKVLTFEFTLTLMLDWNKERAGTWDDAGSSVGLDMGRGRRPLRTAAGHCSAGAYGHGTRGVQVLGMTQALLLAWARGVHT